MERLVYQSACGCQVYRIMNSKPNLYRIQYCPKHESAPDLYEALETITSQFSKVDKLYSRDNEIISQAEQVLAKAKSK